MPMLAPFEGPMLKIERARHHLNDLRQTISDYQRRAKPEFVKTDRAVNPWELQISECVPKIIPIQIGDIAHSLRSSLDVMLCDIATLRGVGLSDMKFPFAASKAAFDDMLSAPASKHPFKKLGPDITSLIAACKPYVGGNIPLRGLHDINNQDKHRLVLPTVHFVSTGADMTPLLRNMTGLNVFSIGRMKVALNVGEPIADDTFYQHPSDAYVINDEAMIICFPKDFPLSGNVLTQMERITQAVAELVETFRVAVLNVG